jgi:putative tryptophan/tyrosine transport system substrate-binding protein
LKAATRDIPIIFVMGADPVELGLVASLNRPGGNFTGVMVPTVEIGEKRLQLLHEAVPAAETIALLVGFAGTPFTQIETRYTQSAARTLGLRLLVFDVMIYTDLTSVFATLVEHQVGAVLMSGAIGVDLKINVLSLAARFALPTMLARSIQIRAGGLLSYAENPSEVARLMGVYTGRIVKGEKPGDLPVIQTTKLLNSSSSSTSRPPGHSV